MPLPPPIRGLRAALVFLTRIPVGGADYREDDWRWSTGWFPFVGLLLGACLAGLWLALPALAPLSRALVVVAFGVALTGAFHEDGLADTADALGGAQDRAKLFHILKDSRLGTFGVTALCLSLLLRVSLLAELSERAPLALVLSHGLARMPPIWLMVTLPYVTGEASAKSREVTRARAPQLVLASGWALSALALCVAVGGLRWQPAVGVLAALSLVAGLCAWRFRARAGGITGDLLGANEQLGELAVLLMLAAL